MATIYTQPYYNVSNPSAANQGSPLKTASGINLDSRLTDALNQIGLKQKSNIGNVYNGMTNQFNADARPTGSYPGSRLATGQHLSMGNLQSGLEGVLGNEGYSDYKSQRDFEQNMNLAKMTGELNRPSTFEQVLSGLSGGAQIGAGAYAMSKNGKKKKNSTLNSGDSADGSSAPDSAYSNFESNYA